MSAAGSDPLSRSTGNPSPPPRAPKLLEQFADALYRQRYAPALVHDYVEWVRRYIFFHKLRHPGEMGLAEAAAFLDYLAGPGEATLFQVAEANQALRLLHEAVLQKPLRKLAAAAGLPEGPSGAAPKLLEQMRHVLRVRHYARRTEDCYVDWTRRFIVFHDKRHPAAMGTPEVSRFLTDLAVNRQVTASTQMQAPVGSSSLQRQGAEWSDS